MVKKIFVSGTSGQSIGPSVNYSLNSDYRERKIFEIGQKIGELHYRKQRLEGELSAINAALLNLDEQSLKDDSYRQLLLYK